MFQSSFSFHTTLVEPELTHVFTEGGILSCPKHVEAKRLANKYWNQLDGILFKQEKSMNETEDADLLSKKLLGLTAKYEKIDHEYVAIMRGIRKCGCD